MYNIDLCIKIEYTFCCRTRMEWKITKPMPKQPRVVLRIPHHKELVDYHQSKVVLRDKDWETSCMLVNRVLAALEVIIKEQTLYQCVQIEHFIRVGSSSEGLKVNSSNEFDVFIKMDILDKNGCSAFKLRTSRDDPRIPEGWAECVKIGTFMYSHRRIARERMRKILQDRSIAVGLRDRLFRSIVQKGINRINKLNNMESDGISLRLSGPAITLKIKDKSNSFQECSSSDISIDLVPALAMDNGHQWYAVPKVERSWKNNSYRKTMEEHSGRKLMRMSSSIIEHETMIDLGIPQNNCLCAVLQILKCLHLLDKQRSQCSQFSSVVTSYHLKSIMTFMSFRDENYEYQWACLTRIFRKFIMNIFAVLRTGYLPSPFCDYYYKRSNFLKNYTITKKKVGAIIC